MVKYGKSIIYLVSKHIIELCKTILQIGAVKLHNYDFSKYGTVAGCGAVILSAC